MINFHVGMKVVCVDADGYLSEGPGNWHPLVKDEIYTIRGIGPMDRFFDNAGLHGDCQTQVWLHEVRRPWNMSREPGYAATRFRPLVQTDISIFQAMLSPTPVKQRESEDA